MARHTQLILMEPLSAPGYALWKTAIALKLAFLRIYFFRCLVRVWPARFFLEE